MSQIKFTIFMNKSHKNKRNFSSKIYVICNKVELSQIQWGGRKNQNREGLTHPWTFLWLSVPWSIFVFSVRIVHRIILVVFSFSFFVVEQEWAPLFFAHFFWLCVFGTEKIHDEWVQNMTALEKRRKVVPPINGSEIVYMKMDTSFMWLGGKKERWRWKKRKYFSSFCHFQFCRPQTQPEEKQVDSTAETDTLGLKICIYSMASSPCYKTGHYL